MPWGGKRKGAGRKRTLSARERWQIGEACEWLWQQEAKRRALAKYEALPTTKAVRDEQGRTELIPLFLRKRSRSSLKDIAADIDDVLQKQRQQTIPIRRLRGERDKIIKDVTTECRRKWKISNLTPDMVEKCWDHFRVNMRKLRAKPT